jgi:protein gp37
VWLGVTSENKQHGLPRLDVLRQIPAAVRFLSCEPLLEDLGEIDLNGINWVIIGGETGPNARSMDTVWAKSIIEQCRAQGVAPWMKQLGKQPSENGETLTVPDANGSNAENMDRWPDTLAALKVRELPKVDSDVIATGVNESELRRIETELG